MPQQASKHLDLQKIGVKIGALLYLYPKHTQRVLLISPFTKAGRFSSTVNKYKINLLEKTFYDTTTC